MRSKDQIIARPVRGSVFGNESEVRLPLHTRRKKTLTAPSTRLLQLAVPLVQTHGFTRAALARAVLDLPQPHAAPLPDGAVSALFGQGDDAQRTLVRAWLEDARSRMVLKEDGVAPRMREVLQARLRMNAPVLAHLPEVCPKRGADRLS